MSLATRDLTGIPLMAAGGPFRGTGSPPEGDFYDENDLAEFARQTNAVVEEVDPFTKLGHNTHQMLARRSGLYTEDDQPATGRWRNFRVEGKGAAARLVADWIGAPEKLARLFEARAFGKRSVEIKPYESQRGKGRFDRVIRAVALLGAKAPAIKTLDDVVALYGDDEIDDADVRVIEYEEAGETSPIDLRIDLGIEPGAESADGSRENEDGADTTGDMPTATDTPVAALSLTEEQRDQLAEILGVEGDLDADQLLARAQEIRAHADRSETDDTGDGGDGGSGGEGGSGDGGDGGEGAGGDEGVQLSEAEYAGLLHDASAGASAAEELRVARRDRTIEGALRDGRLTPGQRDEFVRMFDEDEDMTVRVLSTLLPDGGRAREYGSEDEPQFSEHEIALYREFSDMSGVRPLTFETDDEGKAA